MSIEDITTVQIRLTREGVKAYSHGPSDLTLRKPDEVLPRAALSTLTGRRAIIGEPEQWPLSVNLKHADRTRQRIAQAEAGTLSENPLADLPRGAR